MVNVPFDQLPKEAQRRVKKENPQDFPLRDRRPAQDVDRFTDTPGTPKPKSRWQQIKEGIIHGGEKAGEVGKKGYGKAQEFAKNHPINNPPKRGAPASKEPNRANWKKEPRGRVSQRDIYKDGILVEKVHYGPAKEQRQPKPRRMPRGDPLGGIGSGLKMSDFLPSNRGYGLGGMMSEPYGAPAPAPRRRGRKGSRRQPREQMGGDDYMDRLIAGDYPRPWEGKF